MAKYGHLRYQNYYKSILSVLGNIICVIMFVNRLSWSTLQDTVKNPHVDEIKIKARFEVVCSPYPDYFKNVAEMIFMCFIYCKNMHLFLLPTTRCLISVTWSNICGAYNHGNIRKVEQSIKTYLH